MKKKRKKEETRERLLRSALEVFSEKGYLGATTKEIASRAGLSEMTLFRHFKNKELLFKEVINNFSFLAKLESLLNSLKNKEMDWQEFLKICSIEFLKVLRENKQFILLSKQEFQRYPESVKEIFSEMIERVIELLSVYFRELQERGFVRKEISSECMARAFIGMFYSWFLQSEVFETVKKDLFEEKILSEYFKILFYGISTGRN